MHARLVIWNRLQRAVPNHKSGVHHRLSRAGRVSEYGRARAVSDGRGTLPTQLRKSGHALSPLLAGTAISGGDSARSVAEVTLAMSAAIAPGKRPEPDASSDS